MSNLQVPLRIHSDAVSSAEIEDTDKLIIADVTSTAISGVQCNLPIKENQNLSDIVNSNDGTLHGGTITSDGVSLDGDDDWVDLGNDSSTESNIVSAVSINVWCNLESFNNSDAAPVVCKYNFDDDEGCYFICIYKDGSDIVLSCAAGDEDSVRGIVNITLGTECMITFTWDKDIDSGKFHAYIDSTEITYTYNQGSMVSGISFPTTIPNLELGRALDGEGTATYDYMHGTIASVQIYDKLLTASEITLLYNQGDSALPNTTFSQKLASKKVTDLVILDNVKSPITPANKVLTESDVPDTIDNTSWDGSNFTSTTVGTSQQALQNILNKVAITYDDRTDNISENNRILRTYINKAPIGCVSSYPFSLYSDARDNTGNNNGILSGDAYIDSSGVHLDGNDDWVDLGNDSSLSFAGATDEPFSLSLWINTSADTEKLIAKSNRNSDAEYILDINSNKLCLRLYDISESAAIAQLTDSAVIQSNTLHHICATYSGNGSASGITLYVDSSVVASSADTSGTYVGMEDNSASVRIGVEDSVGEFVGTIDDVQFYHIELNASEVASLYNKGRTGSYIPKAFGISSTMISDLMSKNIYDTNNSGRVDDADKVNQHTVDIDVPNNAKFSDTQSDWNTVTSTSLSYIKNKPDLAAKVNYSDALSQITSSNKLITQSDLPNLSPIFIEHYDISRDEITDVTTSMRYTFRHVGYVKINKLRASVAAAPSGSNIEIFVSRNGSTILSTSLTVDANTLSSKTASTPIAFLETILEDDDLIEIEVNSVGSTSAGKGLKVGCEYITHTTWTNNGEALKVLNPYITAYWKCESLYDYIGGNTLTDDLGITYVSGKNNNAFEFNGGDPALHCSANAAWDFGDLDFCINLFTHFDVGQDACFICSGDSSYPAWQLYFDYTASKLSFAYTESASSGSFSDTVQEAWSPTSSTTYMLSVIRSGNSISLYVDATQVGTSYDCTGDTIYTTSEELCLGNSVDGDMVVDGWIDEVCIIKGRAVNTTELNYLLNSYKA